jgi:mediator of RNA polymerase II transcription subunit 10
MAPNEEQPPTTTPATILPTLTSSIQTLYNILAITSSSSPPTRLLNEFQTLATQLLTISRASTSLDLLVPPEVMQYVQQARNPDIYTREFAELAQRNNQNMKGKMEAFGRFAGVLGREVSGGVPELSAEVSRVLERTGVVERGFYVPVEEEVKVEEDMGVKKEEDTDQGLGTV